MGGLNGVHNTSGEKQYNTGGILPAYSWVEYQVLQTDGSMFPKWLQGTTVSDSGKKWLALRSLGVCTRGPHVVVLRNVRVLHVLARISN